MRYNRRKAMPKLRTNRQNAAFHKLIGSRGLTNEDKAELVSDVTKGRVESSKLMTFDEMNSAIKRLGGTVFDSRDKRSKIWFPKNVVGMISPLQRNKLEQLKASRNMSEQGFSDLCKRMLKGKSAPTTISDAQKLTEAIKAMNARDAKAPKAKTQEVA
jgi:hypothetical protein